MDNIYKTPESNLENKFQEKNYDFELYKITGIGLATFFATALAGGVLLAINFKRLGEEARARNAIVYSILVVVILFVLTLLIPEDMNIPDVVFTAIQVVVMIQLTKQLQAKSITHHVINGGVMASNWKAFGVSLIVLAVLIAIFIPVFMFFMS